MPNSDVMDVLGEQIENRFNIALGDVGPTVAAAPEEHADLRAVMYEYGMLAAAESHLARSENALLEALGNRPDGELVLTDVQLDLAHVVHDAVTARDSRVAALRKLLATSEAPEAQRTTGRSVTPEARPVSAPPSAAAKSKRR